MKAEVKEWWVEALDSGEYEKTVFALHRSDGTFCSLGVLGDLYLKHGGDGEWTAETEDIDWQDDDGVLGLRIVSQRDADVIHTTGLPYGVLKWADMTDVDCQQIVELNDGRLVSAPVTMPMPGALGQMGGQISMLRAVREDAKTFPEIAVWIKEHL